MGWKDFASKEWCIDLFNKAFHQLFGSQLDNQYKNTLIRFGINENGFYGFIKDGETKVRRF